MYKRTSEQKSNYMQELDQWLDELLSENLIRSYDELTSNTEENLPQEEVYAKFEVVFEETKKAIKGKILASYHNGKAAAAPKAGAKHFLKKL